MGFDRQLMSVEAEDKLGGFRAAKAHRNLERFIGDGEMDEGVPVFARFNRFPTLRKRNSERPSPEP